MSNENRKGTFLSIIAVLTLIVAILGASFAYFTATDSSTDNYVTVKSTKIAISYINGQIITADNLIPATKAVAIKGYENKSANGICLDDNRKQICAVFGFDVKNDGNTSQEINAAVLTNLNEFTNLKYIVYDVTDNASKSIVKEENNTFPAATNTVSLFGTDLNASQTVAADSTKKYEVVVYLENLDTAQDDEQDSTYAGTITVGLAGSSNGQVAGQIAGE